MIDAAQRMKLRRTRVIGLGLIVAVIAFDTWIQAWVFASLTQNDAAITVTPFFRLVRVWNPGVSFGMFQGLAHGQWILSLLALGIITVLARLLWRTTCRLHAGAYALIIGGAAGNVLDRIMYGAVADYLDFHAFGYHWPAFNVTDAAIFIGVCLLVLPNKHRGSNQSR